MPRKYEIDDALRAVTLNDGFWGRLVERNRTATLPHVWTECEAEGHMRNLDIAAGKSDADYEGGADRDSNLHKIMEGAAYCQAITPDAAWDAKMDEVIDQFAAAQEPDGYLVSYITSEKPSERYQDIARSHELYCMGHMIEAAVEHYHATGKRIYLEIGIRAADHMDATFGPGKLKTTSGHQEVELALVKLYKAMGEQRYLDLSRYFVDMRGDPQRVHREYSGLHIDEGDRRPGRNRPPQYRQDHEPILEQRYAIGHAVRAGYLYAAMVDLAMACDAPEYAAAAEAIWHDIVNAKLYITGGVGTHQYRDEGFGDPYLLPNDTGYCETCGGIALLLFSHRMGLLTGEAKYADLVETILYNNMLGCTDLEGVNFFYRNPLQVDAPRQRNPWAHPACCPTNIVRIIPQFARLAYAIAGDAIYVDQFAAGTADVTLADDAVRLTQQTNYPWDGRITITVETETPQTFALHVRIPGWVDGRPVASDLYTTEGKPDAPTVDVNGEPIDATQRQQGYCVIERTWRAGDQVTISLPMPIQRVHAHKKVESCAGQTALMRGPLVYCFEQVDNGDLSELALPADAELLADHNDDLLGGVTVIRASERTAVPYYAWNNREPGQMRVWVTDGTDG